MTDAPSAANRRPAYRVRPDSDEELDLEMLAKRQQLIRAEVADVAIGGAQVRYGSADTPKLVNGDRVILTMTSSRYDFDGTVPARVVATSEGSKERIVHLSFEHEDVRLNKRSDEFFELFNRRATYRGVEPDPSADLNATVSPQASGTESLNEFPVSIRNISNFGVSLAVDPDTDRALHSHLNLRLSLELPGDDSAKSITCRVRHRSAVGGLFYYGCEFDWGATLNSLVVVEDLVAYMLERFEQDERIAL